MLIISLLICIHSYLQLDAFDKRSIDLGCFLSLISITKLLSCNHITLVIPAPCTPIRHLQFANNFNCFSMDILSSTTYFILYLLPILFFILDIFLIFLDKRWLPFLYNLLSLNFELSVDLLNRNLLLPLLIMYICSGSVFFKENLL